MLGIWVITKGIVVTSCVLQLAFIPDAEYVTSFTLNGTILVPRFTVMEPLTLSKAGLEPSKSAEIEHEDGVSNTV